MSYVILAGGSALWSVASLHEAMQLGAQYACDGCRVEIVARNPAELRTWRFDHERSDWVEFTLKRAPRPSAPDQQARLAA